MADADILIIRVRQLPCHYPSDPCEGYPKRYRHREGRPLVGWQPCEECQVRRLAEALKTEEERRRGR